jgi:hypothetical protein
LERRLLAAFLLGLLEHFPVVDLFALYPAAYHAAKPYDDKKSRLRNQQCESDDIGDYSGCEQKQTACKD